MTQYEPELSAQGQRLIEQYKEMAAEGYDRVDGSRIDSAYNDFGLKRYSAIVKPHIEAAQISSLLDFGGGGSDWEAPDFDAETGQSAKDYFGIEQVQLYEPARDLLEKDPADCVICMDVLEHIFIADVAPMIRELFSLSKKFLIMNIACYKAAAVLPCGENAHVTVRDPDWWKGIVDMISLDFPDIEVLLMCSTDFNTVTIYDPWKARSWIESDVFTIGQNSHVAQLPQEVGNDIQLTPEQILEFVDLLAKNNPESIPVMAQILQKNVAELSAQQNQDAQ